MRGVRLLLIALALAADPTAAEAVFPGDNGKIAFAGSTAQVPPHIFAMNADGSGRAQLTTGNDLFKDPSWSPDGTRLAYAMRAAGGASAGDIWVMQHDGSGHVRLTATSEDDVEPAWSPDGSSMVFRRLRAVGEAEDSSLFVMSADGSGQRAVTSGMHAGSPTWSPDGCRILFERAVGTSTDLYSVTPAGTDVRAVRTDREAEFSPDWAPDGGRFVFLRHRTGQPEGGAAAVEIFVANADGSGLRQLTDNDVGEYTPTWSPDGRWILFHRFIPAQQGGRLDIFRMNTDGGDVTNLTNSEATESSARWQSLGHTPRRCPATPRPATTTPVRRPPTAVAVAATPSPSPEITPQPSPSPTPTGTPGVVAAPRAERGSGRGLVAAAVAAAAAAGIGAAAVTRLRRRRRAARV